LLIEDVKALFDLVIDKSYHIPEQEVRIWHIAKTLTDTIADLGLLHRKRILEDFKINRF